MTPEWNLVAKEGSATNKKRGVKRRSNRGGCVFFNGKKIVFNNLCGTDRLRSEVIGVEGFESVGGTSLKEKVRPEEGPDVERHAKGDDEMGEIYYEMVACLRMQSLQVPRAGSSTHVTPFFQPKSGHRGGWRGH